MITRNVIQARMCPSDSIESVARLKVPTCGASVTRRTELVTIMSLSSRGTPVRTVASNSMMLELRSGSTAEWLARI